MNEIDELAKKAFERLNVSGESLLNVSWGNLTERQKDAWRATVSKKR